MQIKNAKVFTEQGIFQEKDIWIEQGLFVEDGTSDTVIDAKGLWAIPGLTDIHFHGCVGYDFCDGTHEAIFAMAQYQAKNGITTICPATMTLPEEVLHIIAQAAATYTSDSGAILVGINMEGPFISGEKKGAQNGTYIMEPSLDFYQRLQETSNHLFKLVSIAPEVVGALDFIRAIRNEVVVSIAHTTADYELTRQAFDAGASHITHLYNAMPAYNHRKPGVIGAAADTDTCTVELICDGVHIHPAVIRNTFRLFGAERIVLISDSMMAVGMKNGDYSLGGQMVSVNGKTALLKDDTIAGSVSNLMDCVRICVKEVGIPLEQVIQCAAVNPAKKIGIYNQYGSITPGKVANLILLNEQLNIIDVYIRGKKV